MLFLPPLVPYCTKVRNINIFKHFADHLYALYHLFMIVEQMALQKENRPEGIPPGGFTYIMKSYLPSHALVSPCSALTL